MEYPRAHDWLIQAENDLAWGKSTLDSGFYAQACFIAQQAAEKSLKALAYKRGYDSARGHSVRAIATELHFNGEVLEAAKILDQYYISPRYPDSFPAGAPFEFFSKNQAQTALDLSELIYNKVCHEFDQQK